MARPKVHDEATADSLLAAAAALLRAEGPGGVSVRAVAHAAQVSLRAVYALFGSKQALMDGLAERGYHALAERVGSLPRTEEPAADLVTAGVEGFRAFALGDPEVFRLTFEQVSAEVLRQKRVSRAAYASYAALVERVQRARQAGAVHPERPDEQCVLQFHSLCQGLASAELASRRPPEGPGFWPMAGALDMRAVWRDALRGLVTGFASPPVRADA